MYKSHPMPFRHPCELNDFVVIDLETTGISPYDCEIIQLSAVRYVDHRECDYYSSLVKPFRNIPREITLLTGISNEAVADAPSIDQILPEYLAFALQSPFVTGYNVKFDLSFLSEALGVDLAEELLWFDTMLLARRAIPGLPRYRLVDVCAYIGYDTDFHDALNDCRACGEVLNFLCEGNRMDHALHSKAERTAALIESRQREAAACHAPAMRIVHDGPLAGKNIVFTGELSFSRADATLLAQQAGAAVKTSVSKKTDYVVLGVQDERIVGCDGMSSKEEKARSLIESGCGIEIIDEAAFLRLAQGEESESHESGIPV